MTFSKILNRFNDIASIQNNQYKKKIIKPGIICYRTTRSISRSFDPIKSMELTFH
jgi:hypothetical protein